MGGGVESRVVVVVEPMVVVVVVLVVPHDAVIALTAVLCAEALPLLSIAATR